MKLMYLKLKQIFIGARPGSARKPVWIDFAEKFFIIIFLMHFPASTPDSIRYFFLDTSVFFAVNQ
jgi:hypothetical protein